MNIFSIAQHKPSRHKLGIRHIKRRIIHHKASAASKKFVTFTTKSRVQREQSLKDAEQEYFIPDTLTAQEEARQRCEMFATAEASTLSPSQFTKQERAEASAYCRLQDMNIGHVMEF